MKRNGTKVWTLLLAAALCLPMIAACSGKTTDNPSTTEGEQSSSEVQTEAVTEDEGPKLAFPAQDYEGATFPILTVEECSYEYLADTLTGNRVNDEVYARNREAEEYLNVKLDVRYEPGGWNYRNTYNAIVTQSIVAGDSAFDYVTGMISCIQPLASGAYFMNLFDVPNMDMDTPWWVSSMQDELALNGKLYSIIGDVCLSMYKGFSVYYFNQRLLNDIGSEDPYELVRSGKWTLDKMTEMTVGIGQDVNGDGVWTLENDIYGCITSDVPARSWNSAFDIHIIEIDDSGIPHVAPLSEKAVNAV